MNNDVILKFLREHPSVELSIYQDLPTTFTLVMKKEKVSNRIIKYDYLLDVGGSLINEILNNLLNEINDKIKGAKQ